MRIITVEEHFHQPAVVARVRQLWQPPPIVPDAEFSAFMGDFMPKPELAENIVGARLQHMNDTGIDIQVLSHGAFSPDTLNHPEAVELCRTVNDWLAAQIAINPDRFRGFATIPLYDPTAAADEFRRSVGELGFVGALIVGSFGGVFLDDERFAPILSAAEQVGRPIYVHPGLVPWPVAKTYYEGSWPTAVQYLFSSSAIGWHADAGIHVLRLILSGALDRHPDLKLLSGHWGELAAGWLPRLDDNFSLVQHLERPVSVYYRDQVWITPSGMYNQNQLNFFVAELGADRILHSEDYPYVQRDNVSDFLRQASLSADERAAIAHRNAENLLGISRA